MEEGNKRRNEEKDEKEEEDNLMATLILDTVRSQASTFRFFTTNATWFQSHTDKKR